MLLKETHHPLLVRIHFETRTRREKKAPHAPTYGSMAHVSALGLVLLVRCSMLQQMDVEAEARATEEDRVNTTTCMPGTCDNKILIDDEKAMLILTQVSRDIRGGQQQIKRLFARNLMLLASKGQPVGVSACGNITSSVNFLFSGKASLSK